MPNPQRNLARCRGCGRALARTERGLICLNCEGSLEIEQSTPNPSVERTPATIQHEDQYHTPNRRMIDKQSSFRSSIGKSKSFGGVTTYESIVYNSTWVNNLNTILTEDIKIENESELENDDESNFAKGLEAKLIDPDILFTLGN